MAFNKKTWKDRVSEQPQRRLLTPVDGGEATTVDVTRQEGIVIQEGDAFSAANMNDLETRIKNTFDSDESTLAAVNTKANTNANNITSLQTNLASVSNRVTANTNNITANKTTETNHYNALAERASTLENELTANNKRIYMDYKNGKYGYNTSANRGADTFHPFSSLDLSNPQKSESIGTFYPSYTITGLTKKPSCLIYTHSWHDDSGNESAGTYIFDINNGNSMALLYNRGTYNYSNSLSVEGEAGVISLSAITDTSVQINVDRSAGGLYVVF